MIQQISTMEPDEKYPLDAPIIIMGILFLFGLFEGIISREFVFDEINSLSLLSVPLFLLLSFYSLKDDRYLSIILPFLLLAFPVNINNCFPGVFLESSEMEVVYPYFCHVELFLLLVLMNKYREGCQFEVSLLPYILLWTFVISTITNMIIYADTHYWLLLISGQYPIRILVLILLFVQCVKIDFDYFVIGICISVLFLGLESFVNTSVKGLEVLSSGSLGNNTFGNVVAQLSCLLLYYITWRKNNRILIFPTLFVSLIILIGADTRMAILSSFVVITFVVFPTFSKRIKVAVVIGVIICAYYVISHSLLSSLEGKMDVATTMSAIDISSLTDIEITATETTSSLLTRLSLWETSIKMFFDNPFTGIGWNLFNVLKYKYGFDIEVIIDPHNGYLLFLSQLGLWGALWIYYIFFRCWIIFKKTCDLDIKTFAIFNMGMTICELSNAGTYKYNVLSFLLFISIYIQKEFSQREAYI